MDAFSLEAMRRSSATRRERDRRQTRDAAQARGGILSRTARAGPSRQLAGLVRGWSPRRAGWGGRASVRGTQPSAPSPSPGHIQVT